LLFEKLSEKVRLSSLEALLVGDLLPELGECSLFILSNLMVSLLLSAGSSDLDTRRGDSGEDTVICDIHLSKTGEVLLCVLLRGKVLFS